MRDVNKSDDGAVEVRSAFDESFAIAHGPDRRNAPQSWRQHMKGWLGREERGPDGRRADEEGDEPDERRIPDHRYLVQNRTPYLIRVSPPTEDFGDLVLAPFAQRVMSGSRLAPFEQSMRAHRQRHELLVARYDPSDRAVDRIGVVWLVLVILLAVVAYDLIAYGSLRRPEFFGMSAVVLGVLVAVWCHARWLEARRIERSDRSAGVVGDTASGVGSASADGNETARSARRLLTLVIVVAVGAVLPTIAIVAATDAHQFLVMEGGLRVISGQESRLVSRVFQITYTCVLALFPALLYFQFDRMRAGHIRDEWVRALFRMDGRLRTLADVNATYGDRLYEATGNSHDSVRGLGGKHSPIVICTILIALGWTILVSRTESYDFSAITAASQQAEVAERESDRAADAAASAEQAESDAEANAAAADAVAAAGGAITAGSATAEIADVSSQDDSADASSPVPAPTPTLPAAEMGAEAARETAGAAADVAAQASQQATVNESRIQSTDFFQLLAPNPSAAGMAFLGAYFYGVYLVLRSYFRGDLRSKIYNQITARLVTVVVVAYLINSLFVSAEQQQLVWVLSFLAGIVPTTVLDRVFAMVTAGSQWVLGDTRLASDRPLSHIDGIDVYDSARLESEGVPDVAALANSDLSALMISTKLPIGRLVDWADQAVMMVVVGTPGSRLDSRVACLRTRGIRTGTDLLAAADDAHRGELDACLKAPPAAPRGGVLQRRRSRRDGDDVEATTDAGREIAEAPIDFAELREAVRRQPVMSQILQWRSSPFGDVHRCWLELPEFGEFPGPSPHYRGPLPDPDAVSAPVSR